MTIETKGPEPKVKKDRFTRFADFVIENFFIITLVVVFLGYCSWLVYNSNVFTFDNGVISFNRDKIDSVTIDEDDIVTVPQVKLIDYTNENFGITLSYPEEWTLNAETQSYDVVSAQIINLTKEDVDLRIYLFDGINERKNECESSKLYRKLENGWYRIQNLDDIVYTKWLFNQEDSLDDYTTVVEYVGGQVGKKDYYFCTINPMYIFPQQARAIEIQLTSGSALSGETLQQADQIVESIVVAQ